VNPVDKDGLRSAPTALALVAARAGAGNGEACKFIPMDDLPTAEGSWVVEDPHGEGPSRGLLVGWEKESIGRSAPRRAVGLDSCERCWSCFCCSRFWSCFCCSRCWSCFCCSRCCCCCFSRLSLSRCCCCCCCGRACSGRGRSSGCWLLEGPAGAAAFAMTLLALPGTTSVAPEFRLFLERAATAGTGSGSTVACATALWPPCPE
jgi:hypothetical protein